MGQKIVLSGVSFTDTSLPIVRDDPMLSAGSLFLFDPGHSLGAFSGLPALAATVPNIAWQKAAALLGSGTAASLAATVSLNATVAGQMVVERTAKGGIHGIISQAAQASEPLGYALNLPDAVRAYVAANYARGIYVSLWSLLTRKAIGDNPAPQSNFHHANNTSNYGFLMQGGRANPSGTTRVVPTLDDRDVSAGSVPLNRYTSLATSAVSGTGPAANPIRLGVGSFDGWAYSATRNKQASKIIYRAYIEDLTASGRTWAQADAIDYALYQAAFAVGGKFYGDTYTAPATLP